MDEWNGREEAPMKMHLYRIWQEYTYAVYSPLSLAVEPMQKELGVVQHARGILVSLSMQRSVVSCSPDAIAWVCLDDRDDVRLLSRPGMLRSHLLSPASILLITTSSALLVTAVAPRLPDVELTERTSRRARR